MKQNIFTPWDRHGQREESIQDIVDSVPSLVGSSWTLLQTPIILDNDLIDGLMVNESGILAIIKVFDANERIEYMIGPLFKDYFALQEKLHKLKRVYPTTFIDLQQKMRLMIFIPSHDEQFRKTLATCAVPFEVYVYSFIMSSENTGLVVHKMDEQPAYEKKPQDYSSIIKVLGENVRSDQSVSERVPDIAAAPGTLNQEEKAALTAMTDETSVSAEEKEEIKGRGAGERLGVGPSALSEEELLAFFDFEKKLERYLAQRDVERTDDTDPRPE